MARGTGRQTHGEYEGLLQGYGKENIEIRPKNMKEVYVLLADGDGTTMRSIDTPFGVAVTTEVEAGRFVKEGHVGYTHSYAKIRIFTDKDEAIKWAFQK